MLYSGPLDEANPARHTSKYDEPISIFCDNTSAISISKNLVMHSKTKHIPIKFHFLAGTSHIKEYQVGVHWDKRRDCRYLHQTSPKRDI
jgi:hypothetical protein